MKAIDSTKLKTPHLFKYKLNPKGLEKRVEFGRKEKGVIKITELGDIDYEHLKKTSEGFNYLLKEKLLMIVQNEDSEVKKTGLEKKIEKLVLKKTDEGLDEKEEATLQELKIKQAGKQ